MQVEITVRLIMCQATAFIENLVTLTPEQLAQQYQSVGEAMCEEGDDGKLPNYLKALTVIDAVGKFKYGQQYEEANSKIALNALMG
jgi:hypothetical protein